MQKAFRLIAETLPGVHRLTIDSAIPCKVVSPQSVAPFRQASALNHKRTFRKTIEHRSHASKNPIVAVPTNPKTERNSKMFFESAIIPKAMVKSSVTIGQSRVNVFVRRVHVFVRRVHVFVRRVHLP